MNLPLKWLKSIVDVDVPIKALCDRLTMTGSKVELWHDIGEDVQNVVVGRVVSIERHPDSDHLWVCLIDVGASAPVQIITGAQNVRQGDLVPAALDGAKLPGGVEIKNGLLRGLPSNGMLCSMQELGLSKNECPYGAEDGILILESGTPGQDAKEVLGLDDTVIEFEITPNRPDCLSVLALARETAVSFGKPYSDPVPKHFSGEGSTSDYLTVDIAAPELCRRYAARVVKDVKIALSPAWIRERLFAAGVRPINNIVDITNYVMLEYGQPMHAFDYKCISGSHITVRTALDGESFQTLDSKQYALKNTNLVIADDDKAVALAGVMGGLNSEIESDTATVVFESANFNGPCVRRTSRGLGIRTDASGCFEKGLDPENCLPALERAIELVVELGAGTPVGENVDVYPSKPAEKTIPFEPDRVNAFLGTEIPAEHMLKNLAALGIPCIDGVLHIPSRRADMSCMNDVAEEVARIEGYDNIPTAPIVGAAFPARLTYEQKKREEIGELMRALGHDECLTYTFVSPKHFDRMRFAPDDPRRVALPIANPLGEDTGIMRTTALLSLIESLARNAARRNPKASLFEIGKVYKPKMTSDGKIDNATLPEETSRVVAGMYGEGVDFFAIKGRLETLLDKMNVTGVKFSARTDDPTFHPGRAATVFADGEELGVVGQLHPVVAANYGVDQELYVFDIGYETMLAHVAPESRYVQLPRFPAMTRDIAIVCDESLPAGDVRDAIDEAVTKAVPDALEGVEIFDVYRGAQLPAGKKSLAYTITLRHTDRTLTDKEADAAFTAAVETLKARFGATLR